MQVKDHLLSHTVNVKNLPTRRVNKIRFSWFVMGAAFGAFIGTVIELTEQYADSLSASTLQDQLQDKVGEITNLVQLPQFASLTDPTTDVPADTASAEAVKPTIIFPLSLQLEVQKGDTLLSMLTDTNVAYDEAYDAVQAIRKVYNPRALNVGQNVSLNLDKSEKGNDIATISELAINVSPAKSIKLSRTSDGNFRVDEIKAPLVKHLAHAGGTITSSLYETGTKSGIPANLLGDIITAYSYDVDFQRDIKDGDALDVLYEQYSTEDGTLVKSGKVVYAALNLGNKELKIYRFEDADGNAGYYNDKGESVKKALLKTPINGARISSSFGMRRHPVLGYSKMHKGVDFAAPSGTPIYAAGDGKVMEADAKGSYGNYVRIKHNDKYSTAYAHISRFAKGIRAGSKVKQGQVIAYVGSTGRSTGAHLHFEVLAGNAQVNPSSTKFKTGRTLSGKELAEFKRNRDQVQTTLAALPLNGKTQVAAADTQSAQ